MVFTGSNRNPVVEGYEPNAQSSEKMEEDKMVFKYKKLNEKTHLDLKNRGFSEDA